MFEQKTKIGDWMLIKTLLNNCQRFKSFVYGKVEFIRYKLKKIIRVEILPRKNSKAICSVCGRVSCLYDKLDYRYFEFIPIWGFSVFFYYQMRRVDCKSCGVKIEKVPWSNGKSTMTTTFMHYLSNWARHLSWSEVAKRFKVSWDKVAAALKYIVDWGRAHQSLEGITALGVDEIYWGKKKEDKYLTLVYQINRGSVRLLWMCRTRTAASFKKFFTFLGKERCDKIKYICSDMWKAYLKIIREKLKNVVHILDRFHIVAMLNKALNEVRAGEHRKMKADGHEPVLTRSKWCLLKRKENLTAKQEVKLKELLSYNLKSTRAYLLKEDFHGFWDYVSSSWAEKFFNRWTTRVMRSKIEPLKKVVKTLRKHKPLILNWFKAKKKYSSGIVEGLNNKIKVTMRKSYGFRSYKYAEIALYHALGKLPEPELTHKFF